MIKKINKIREDAILEIKNADNASAEGGTSEKMLEEIKIKYFGRKGLITLALKEIANLEPSKRPEIGSLLNQIKTEIKQLLNEKAKELKNKDVKQIDEIDISFPGTKNQIGKKHPLTQMMDEIKEIFVRLGFKIVYGPEIETEYYNFEALNTPSNHPARDMQATFYLSDGRLLRTHTSSVQIRTMEKKKPPLRIISIGKCFRSDPADASHSPVFHQVEGLMIDENISFGNLKAILEVFFAELFGQKLKIRLTPSFFPFTEPSAEVAVECVLCKGIGCSVCKKTGWLEVFGSGMVDPNVFKAVNYDSKRYTGFAFGGGIDRLAMIKYKIDDIRLFYQNDIRFLKQF